MEFRILGPLEVADGDAVLPLTGAKQRALLAILLLNANQVVSSDRLIDALWGEQPPDSGATALQVQVSRLRKTLGEGGTAVVTKATGYAIQLDRDQLDLHRFERLLEEADAAEPAAAADKLREAGADALLALAEPLARRPPRELIVAQLLAERTDLTAVAAHLEERRDGLLTAGIVARSAAFTSGSPAVDIVRMATEQDVDLLLIDGPPALLQDAQLAAVMRSAPCDVAVLVGGEPTPGPVLVPFAGAEHDWSAVELGAWIAGGWDVPLRLAGPAIEDGKDASRLLANA